MLISPTPDVVFCLIRQTQLNSILIYTLKHYFTDMSKKLNTYYGKYIQITYIHVEDYKCIRKQSKDNMCVDWLKIMFLYLDGDTQLHVARAVGVMMA